VDGSGPRLWPWRRPQPYERGSVLADFSTAKQGGS
jgi:hypothetical protein